MKPKIVFCQAESLGVHTKVAADLGLDIKIVTFGDRECSFSKFIEKYDDGESEQDFKWVFNFSNASLFLSCCLFLVLIKVTKVFYDDEKLGFWAPRGLITIQLVNIPVKMYEVPWGSFKKYWAYATFTM